MSAICCLLILSIASVPVLGDFTLYPNGLGTTNDIDSTCITSLNRTLECNPALELFSSSGFYGTFNNGDIQEEICSSSCASSLASYHDIVFASCGDSEPWDGIPATWAGDTLWAYFNRTCLTDPETGATCNDEISSWMSSDYQTLQDIPTEQLCSTCFQLLLQTVQNTAYSNYGENLVEDYEAAQKICNVSYPTTVIPSITNITAITNVNANATYANKTITCLSGNYYTVTSGDTCDSIAQAESVSPGTLRAINNIFPDCSNLAVGASLCLPQACVTYTVQSNDTCWTIGSSYSIGLAHILAWNPTINAACSNLQSDSVICISLPGPTYTPSTISGVTTTTAAVYATTTVAPPGATPYGTTSYCGKYYQVQTGDICQLISLNYAITLELFEAINPSIDVGCTNLIPGEYYCILPTQDWNNTKTSVNSSSTITSAYATAPAPTPTGTTRECYGWHTVVTGDNCALLESEYGITMVLLQSWNPSLDSSCSNLVLGDAYCVDGAAAETTSATTNSATVTATATTTTTIPTTTSGSASYMSAPAPTPSDTTADCYAWHTVVDGDYCYLLETEYSITFAELQGWNPSLDDNCDNLLLGDAYCVSGN